MICNPLIKTLLSAELGPATWFGTVFVHNQGAEAPEWWADDGTELELTEGAST